MLDLDRHIIGDVWMSTVKLLDNKARVGWTVPEIGVAKGDVPRTGFDLLIDVGHDGRAVDYPKPSIVDRNDGAVTTEVLAATTCFGVANHPL